MTKPDQPNRDLFQVTLAVICIAILMIGTYIVMLPFLPALIWATMITVATWPLMLRLQHSVGGRRSLAAAIMTVVLVLILMLPLSVATGVLTSNKDLISSWAGQIPLLLKTSPPTWIEKVPLVGTKIAVKWHEFAASDPQLMADKVTPYVGAAVRWFISQLGNVGILIFHFLLTVILSAILFVKGEAAAAGVKAFARRLGGIRGEGSVILAGQAIRAVALGIIVTALLQSLFAGIGMWIVGIPNAAILTAIIFLLGIIQVGPFPVLLPCLIWLYWSGATTYGIILTIFAVVVALIDNLVRPLLIKKGADLPLLLIFAGVIGGLISFGMVGLFVGPVILAVSYTLVNAWINNTQYAE